MTHGPSQNRVVLFSSSDPMNLLIFLCPLPVNPAGTRVKTRGQFTCSRTKDFQERHIFSSNSGLASSTAPEPANIDNSHRKLA
uniref:Uncharacterized protein n=1 Tax=Knipowitschia caucasica TaxID=637954 RepID=A0AAV2MT24_KNICA